MTEPEPVRRTSEIEEVSNLYFIHPVAAVLTRWFAAIGVRPNAVSLAGMAFGIGAGVCYFHVGRPGFAVAGFLLMIAWHVMDGADGQLARLTKTQSELGKVLDGVCDYVTFIAVYAGIGVALAERDGVWVLGLVAVSGVCHAVQSAAYEAQREAYTFWGWGRGAAPGSAGGGAGWLYGVYAGVQRLISGVPAGFDGRLAAAVAGRQDDLRAEYRRFFAPSVRRWAVLCANYRTAGIFVCAVLGVPVVYFWVESVGLSLVLGVLLAGQRRLARRFLRGVVG